jgi:CHAT domain-containing protein/tetratricopeptide (TPR) repeat protein
MKLKLAGICLTLAAQLLATHPFAQAKTANTEPPQTEASKGKATSRIEELVRKAKYLRSRGEIASAILAWEHILEIVEQEPGPSDLSAALCLEFLGNLYEDNDQSQKAIENFERALSIKENILGKNHPDTASAIHSLAFLYLKKGDLNRAEELSYRALEINTKELGPSDPVLITSLILVAGIHEKQEKLALAESALTIAISIQERSQKRDDLTAASLIERLAGNYELQARHKEASTLYQRVINIRKASLGLGHSDVAKAILRLARTHRSQGNTKVALSLDTQALEIQRRIWGDSHQEIVRNLNAVATDYQLIQQYKQSESYLLRALSIQDESSHPNALDAIESLSLLAEGYLRQGRHSEALTTFRRLHALREKTLGTSNPATIETLSNIALMHRLQGRHQEAVSLSTKILTTQEKLSGSDSPEVAKTLIALAGHYQAQKLYRKAQGHILRALGIQRKTLSPDNLEVAETLNLLGNTYLAERQIEKAEAPLMQSLTIKEKILGDNHPDIISSVGSMAILYTLKEEHQKALGYIKRVLASVQEIAGNDHPALAMFLSVSAVAYSSLGKYENALSALRRSAAIEFDWLTRELALLPDHQRSSQLRASSLAWELVFGLIDYNPSALRLATEMRLNRQGLMTEIQQRQSIITKQVKVGPAITQEIQHLTQSLASTTLGNTEREAIREKLNSLEGNIYRQQPDMKIPRLAIEFAARLLPSDGVLVEFQKYRTFKSLKSWSHPEYMALILNPDGAVTYIKLGPAAAIDESIHKALAASTQDQRDAETLWSQLSDQILKPLLTQLSGSRQWFISPDGELNRVPFAALPAPQQPNVPLAEAVQLRLITTGRELIRLQKANTTGGRPLVMANPNFDRKGTRNLIAETPITDSEPRRRSADLSSTRWSPLPASEQEGQAIASLLSTDLVSGADATTTTLQRHQGPRVMHIATHGFFVADQETKPADPLRIVQEQAPQLQGLRQEDPQLRSGLVLAGANQPDADPKDDGYLTAAEALMLNLKGTELVVLSACSTGQGDIRTGEGVYGLQRSLTVAGARSTLLSLWKVDDAATADFMTRFYTRLKAGEARSDALAATQKEFRDGIAGDGQWKTPYYWAAWQLVGDWRPIQGL